MKKMTISELLERLDGCGLILTDDELLESELKDYGLSLDSIITMNK